MSTSTKLTIARGTVVVAGALVVAGLLASAAGIVPAAGQAPALPSLEDFMGRSFFEDPWVAAPASTTLRDGLGPLYNAHACASCHRPAGRIATGAGATAEPPTGMILRVGRRAGERFGPDPVYGNVIQRRAVPAATTAAVPGEARWRLAHVVADLDDGQGAPRRLAWPEPRIEAFAHGEPAPGLRVSARLAPGLAGVGRIERIADATLLALEDPEDRDGDGISGRAHRWRDTAPVSGPDSGADRFAADPRAPVGPRIGRFGHKAVYPSLAWQVAAALRDDIGITSRFFPAESCTMAQRDCASAPDGAGPDGPHEISDSLFDALVAHVAALPPAATRRRAADAGEGARRFGRTGCAACHIPALPASDGSQVALHSDLLLHDMGTGLADALGEGDATGAEWRTAPLAGLGQRERGRAGLLHDGRAGTLVDAILWHGGEAAPARERFRTLDEPGRHALLDYLRGL